jgi:hypothetical protein
MKSSLNLKTQLCRDFNFYAVPQDILFIVNQYITLLLTKESSLDYLIANTPQGVAHLLLWTLATVQFCKLINPMIFMTKDYFMQRVTCEEEMYIV